MRILVTGGAGYIGSHTVVELLNNNYEVTVVDNLTNSREESLKRVAQITGKTIDFHEFDLRDEKRLGDLFANSKIDAVIHFAGYKAVDKSVSEPIEYYDNNLVSTLVLAKTMDVFGVRKLVFSSSCTVYGQPEKVPITEDMKIQPTNPYGQTKAMIEQMLSDFAKSNRGWQITSLRYFNPIGAHESGLIGEDPNGVPNNLLPYVTQVAVGKLKEVSVFGDDYKTVDGSGVRDYIHVVDLAKGHLAALENEPEVNSVDVYNLGTGKGSSVLEVIAAFEKASGKTIPYKVVGRRPGDVEVAYADVTNAANGLHWKTEKTLDQACKDSWRWQSKNPGGYQ